LPLGFLEENLARPVGFRRCFPPALVEEIMIRRATLCILATGIAVFGANGRDVSICLEGNADLPPGSLDFAANRASAIYYAFGVRLRWHVRPNCEASHDVVRITIADQEPQDAPGDAMAYAHPYEGRHVLVMYGRVRRLECYCERNPALGYVLAHEIAHVLEGISRHSESGILKAHWDRADFEAMLNGSLRFAKEDVSLIQLGLNTLLAGR
jgi:hypothetical protein